jgi:cytochrome P450
MRNAQYPFSPNSETHVDLSSHDAYTSGAPFETFKRLRREDPMSWTAMNGGRGFWSVTRHEDIMKLNADTELLSSARGIRMEDQSEEEYEARKTFQETDPPQHAAFRMLVNEAFSRRSIAQYERQIRSITAELLDRVVGTGDFDATDMIARKLPMRMLAQIIGIPDSDNDWLVDKGDALISNSDPEYTDFVVDKINTDEYRLLPFRSPAAVELFDYANDLLKRMRAGAQFGVLNLIVQPDSTGRRISDDEFRNFFCLLVAAGNDTTRYSIAATMHALANDPRLFAEVKKSAGDPEFMRLAADEMIRWASPTTHFRRTATRDFDFQGKRIKAGDKVVLWFVSANRDADAFDEPEEINLSRKPNRFLSFGQGGPHVCLGMWLAKLEVRIVMEELARSVSVIEQTGPHEYLRSNFILGIKHLPVRMAAS